MLKQFRQALDPVDDDVGRSPSRPPRHLAPGSSSSSSSSLPSCCTFASSSCSSFGAAAATAAPSPCTDGRPSAVVLLPLRLRLSQPARLRPRSRSGSVPLSLTVLPAGGVTPPPSAPTGDLADAVRLPERLPARSDHHPTNLGEPSLVRLVLRLFDVVEPRPERSRRRRNRRCSSAAAAGCPAAVAARSGRWRSPSRRRRRPRGPASRFIGVPPRRHIRPANARFLSGAIRRRPSRLAALPVPAPYREASGHPLLFALTPLLDLAGRPTVSVGRLLLLLRDESRRRARPLGRGLPRSRIGHRRRHPRRR